MLKIQIDLGVIKDNLLDIKKKLPHSAKICAVIKANAYSMGDIQIAELLESTVDCFGVATAGEGVRLRAAGIKADILVFGVCADAKTAAENDLIITVNSLREIQNITVLTRVHIAVNTGMNRFGVNSVNEFQKMITAAKRNPAVSVEGMYTHFAYEDDAGPEVDRQLAKFQPYVRYFRRHFPTGIIHAAASGTMYYPPAVFDMVRVGKALYGGIRGTAAALTVTSRIAAVHVLRPNETVGYAGMWRAGRPAVIGVVAGGYADGINTRFGGHSFVTVNGVICPIVGRVCMDYFFIILPTAKNMLNRHVSIISAHPGQTLLDITAKTGVIVCDILCGLKHTRAEVSYLHGGRKRHC